MRIQQDLENFKLPDQFGTIQKINLAGTSTLIHIQDAHAEMDAQKSIEEILAFLNSEYGIKNVFMEGAPKGEVSKDLLRFFKDEKANQQLADYLLKQGIVTGSGLYLLNDKRNANGYGVEHTPLYRRNLIQFQSIYREKNKSDLFLSELKKHLSTISSHYFNPDLSKFFKEWLMFQDERQDVLGHLNVLDSSAARFLSLNLHDPINQFEYSQLLRYFKIKELTEKQRSEDAQMLDKEKNKFFAWLDKSKLNEFKDGFELLLHFSKEHKYPFNIRTFLERFYLKAQAGGFQFKSFPVLTQYLGLLLLQQELDSSLLFTEISNFFESYFPLS